VLNRFFKNCAIELGLLFFLTPSQTVYAADSLKVGDLAPTFVLRNLHDRMVYLRDFCGEPRRQNGPSNAEVVILSFFATWCFPCQEEIPILQKFYADFQQEPIHVLLIAVGEGKEKVQSFVSAKGVSLPVLLDSFATTAKNYGVANKAGKATLPQLFIIDQKGFIQLHQIGFEEKQSLRDVLVRQVGKLLN